MVRGIIFDCDGTLIDSRARMVPFYNRVFARCGLPLLDPADPETVTACVSLSDADIFARYIPDPGRRALAAACAAASSDDDLTADLAPVPHAIETLHALRPAFRLAVATNRGDDMKALARRFSLDRLVDVIVTASDVERPKPAPDMLLLAARRLHLEPGELLFVGDTEVDRDAACEAGTGFVLYDPDGCRDRPSDPSLWGADVAVGERGRVPCLADLADLSSLVGLDATRTTREPRPC